MVLKSQPMSDEMVARVATQTQSRVDQEAALKAAIDSLQLRQWCVDQAIKVCGNDGLTWYKQPQPIVKTAEELHKYPDDPPDPLCAVVPIAEDILRFITGGEKT